MAPRWPGAFARSDENVGERNQCEERNSGHRERGAAFRVVLARGGGVLLYVLDGTVTPISDGT